MPFPVLPLPSDLHLVAQQALTPANTQTPQILTPQVITPNNPNVVTPGQGNQSGAVLTPKGASAAPTWKPFFQGYFDAGASDLIGYFSTQVLRYGMRSGQHDFHGYVRNETLDTTGTDLPFRNIVQGTSLGVGYRYWFPGNQLFATISVGEIVSGTNKNKDDIRIGLAGYTNSTSEKYFNDIYGDFFYIDIAKDTFLTARYRNGLVLNKRKDGVLTGYTVGQFFYSGKGLSGTENRIEAGFGVGYTFRNVVSANLELRAGYSYRGLTNDRSYLNPQFVLSGGF